MKKAFLLIISLAILGNLCAIKTTNSFFSDQETKTNNIISAANDFAPGAPSPSPSPTPTPSGLSDHIVISEIQIHGANANQDFVELYNPKDTAEDLSGWKLRKKTSSGSEDSLAVIPSGKSIPANGFFLWANNQSSYDVSIDADISNGNNISENNSIALLKPDNSIVDQVAWGNGTNQYVEGSALTNGPATNQSIERKAYSDSTTASMALGGSDETNGNGFDSEDNSFDFVLRENSQPQNTSSLPEIP